MKFAIRREVDVNDPAGSLADLSRIPIELALPYRLEDYLVHRKRLLGIVADIVDSEGIDVQSIHATQGHLTDSGFWDWGLQTVKFAEELSANVVVFHPEVFAQNVRLDKQILALQNIKRLQRETDTVQVGIEAFGNKKRVLTPEEICQKGLWLVLDTSHLFPERSLQIVEQWHKQICEVHLSEGNDKGQHQPVQGYGYQILDALKAKGWDGPVTLEYMFEYHGQMIEDRKRLEERYGK